jgi:hypothetical protein
MLTMADREYVHMAKKKTEDSSSAKPRAAAPRGRAPRKAVSTAEAPPVDPARVSATQPIAVAADMSTPGTPEGIADATTTSTAINPPSHDEIAEAAYHRYRQRGGGHGMDFEDWLEAEQALRSRR